MDSINSVSHENKKKQLKRQIVPSGSPLQEEEDSREIVHRTHQRVVRKRLIILAVLATLAATAALVLSRYERHHTSTDYQMVWKWDLVAEAQEAVVQGEGSFRGYRSFGDGVLKYTKDGAIYLDVKGKVVWVQSYETRSPVVSVNGDFVAIGDRQGNSIYICDQNGIQGQAAMLLPILRVTVSVKGVVAALREDSKASYIYLYKRDGNPLDIMVKPLLSGDGYPVDLSLSPSGTQLITSHMYLDQGMIKYKIVFYNFGLSKNDPNRVVGIFSPKDLGDAMVGRIRFPDESYSVMLSDKGIQLSSTRVKTSPGLVSQTPIEENIRNISYAQDKVGIVTDNMGGGDLYRLRTYDREGSPVFEKLFNYQYTGFDIDGDLILLYNDSSCRVYNTTGAEKCNGISDFTVSKVFVGRFPGILPVMGPQEITETKPQWCRNKSERKYRHREDEMYRSRRRRNFGKNRTF